MSIRVIEKRVLSSDGIHQLEGKVYFPEGKVRGLFQVVHGMTEHIARYDGFMRELANEGWIVFGYDHLGHGKTANAPEELGFIAVENGWEKLAMDVAVYAKAVRGAIGEDLPYVLFGHSMGSFIVRLAAGRYICPDRLIVMGTGGPNPAGRIGIAAIDLVKLCKGDLYISDFVYSLAFSSYNKRFAAEKDPNAWLTNDKSVREAYAADPFCTFRFTVSAMRDLVMLNILSNKKEAAQALPMGLPVLLLSGEDDPVGEYGKGVLAVEKMMREAGLPVTTKIYKGCRHEILNDYSRENVIRDILEFITPTE